MMEFNGTVQNVVNVFDDSSSTRFCSSRRGPTQSQEEITQVVAWYLSREYSNTVEVNYNDLARPSVKQQHPEMVERLQRGEIVLPAAFVDGTEVSQGFVDYFSISRALEMARKAAAARKSTED